MATYGSFPGVRVQTESGGISSVEIGAEEKILFFGEANYDASNNVSGDDTSLDVSASEPEQINAPRVADLKFGEGSELAEAMKEALANGANIDFLYGVAVPRVDVTGESFGISAGSTGSLENVEILEDTSTITTDGDVDFEFRYDGAPNTPTADDRIYLNPLTGEYAVTSGALNSAPTTIDYTYNDYSTAFEGSAKNVVNEDETGIFFALSDSDSVSQSLNTTVATLREDYQLVNALSFAEPNASEETGLDPGETDFDSTRGGADARYDTGTYDTANSSVQEEHYYKFAPAREEDVRKTIGGGIGGLFAGNPINDPIYNEVISGYQDLEQSLRKSESDSLRNEDVIPVRSGGNTRVKGNRSTAFSLSDTVAAEFWTRRITDRVILIGKQIGDTILGRINDEDTRNKAERRIEQEMRSLESQRLIRPNTETDNNWSVRAYEDPNNPDEVNIDIAFSPYGIVKNVDETITVDTS